MTAVRYSVRVQQPLPVSPEYRGSCNRRLLHARQQLRAENVIPIRLPAFPILMETYGHGWPTDAGRPIGALPSKATVMRRSYGPVHRIHDRRESHCLQRKSDWDVRKR